MPKSNQQQFNLEKMNTRIISTKCSFSIILLFQIFTSSAQINNCSIPIKIDQINQGYGEYAFLYFKKLGIDTIIRFDENKRKSITTIINLINCEGKLNLKQFSSKESILICEGNYLASIDTLKALVEIVQPIPPYKISYEVQLYFQPLRDGIWKYYSDTGILKEIRIYEEGWLKDIIKN